MRTTYTAAVEVATKHPLDVEMMAAALSQYAPEIGQSARGWLELRISLPASNLTQACMTALSVASAATGAEAIACEVMTESEYECRHAAMPSMRGPLERGTAELRLRSRPPGQNRRAASRA
jgi:hypothetical protein